MKKIITISLAFLAITLTGCLDDDKYALDPSGTENVIEFTDISVPISPLGAVHPAYVTSFSVAEEADFEVVISYSGPNSNSKDIELTLMVDPLALEAYNEQQASETFTPYEVLPSNLFTMESMTVTLPKGQTKLTVPITVFPDQFDLSKKYAIPLRIASASSGTLSSVYSAAIFGVVVKNRYDGIYTVESDMFDSFNAAFVELTPKTVSLRTVDGSTVDYYDEDYHLAGHIFFTGTGASYYGSFLARFTFDNATGEVLSVVNAFGQGAGSLVRSGKLDPTQPATPSMTFEADGVTPISMEVWYVMVQGGADRTFWKEEYTYVGPRP
jgi:hypothetical protein